MKVSSIKRLMKNSGNIAIIQDIHDGQWIGCFQAIYRADDFPDMDEKSIRAIFDISNKDFDKKYTFTHEHSTPTKLNLSDVDEGEKSLESYGFSLNGRMLLKGNSGTILLDCDYLRPCGDQYELYERFVPDDLGGGSYIAVKKGVSLIAIIMSWDDIEESLLNEIGGLYAVEQMHASMRNK